MPDLLHGLRYCGFLFTLFWVQPAAAQYYYYFPGSPYIPVLQHAFDATLSAGPSKGSGFHSFEGQVTFSPVHNVGLMGSYLQAGNKAVKELKETGTTTHFWNAGVGIYQPVGKSCVSLFGGYGEGKVFNAYGGELYSRFLIKRWFVQPALMYQKNYFFTGIVMRFNYLIYSKGETAFNIPKDQLQAIRNIEKRAPLFMPELGAQIGMDFNAFSVQMSLSSTDSKTAQYSFIRFNSQISLSLDIGNIAALMHKKKK